MERNITPADLQSRLTAGPGITLLDVRRREDRAEDPVAITGASWHDPTAIEGWSGELDPAREIVVYCVHGGPVSRSVMDTLHAKGLNARLIEGGLEAWKDYGGATEPAK